MKTRQARRLLWTTAAAGGALAMWALVWASKPLSANTSRSVSEISDARGFSAIQSVSPTLDDDLQRLSLLNLRRALHDPPPPPPRAAAPIPPLNIHLTGTIYEPGHCQAMIQLSDGSIQLKSVGDVIGDARITDIQENSVIVEYFGKSMVLTVPKREGN